MKRNKCLLLVVFVTVFMLSSFKSNKINSENIYIVDSNYTEFNNPFIVKSMPYMRLIEQDDTTLILIFSLPHSNRDSLFAGSFYKGDYFNATYLHIIDRDTTSHIDLTYSRKNSDFKWRVEESQKLSSGINYLYSFNFRLKFDFNKIEISSFGKEGVLTKICDYQLVL